VDYFYNITPRLEFYEENRLRVEHDEAGNIIRITICELIEGELKPTFVYNVKPPKKLVIELSGVDSREMGSASIPCFFTALKGV
jgi:hypothetical protein